MTRQHAIHAALRRAAATGAVCAIAASAATAAAQQTPPRLSDGVSVPWQSVTSTDDSTAIFVNPANVALGSGLETRLTMLYTSDEARLPLRGYAIDFALPFWIFGTGLRVDWMDPPDRAPAPFSIGGVGQKG
jgi:protease-4